MSFYNKMGWHQQISKYEDWQLLGQTDHHIPHPMALSMVTCSNYVRNLQWLSTISTSEMLPLLLM
jgi:hypothetical protein